MSTDGMALFDLAEKRLAWLGQRQSLLAQNIANANTPGYAARDMAPFAQALARAAPTLATTDARHIALHTGFAQVAERPEERAPDGNAVSMDEQLTKVADTDSAQSLVATLYHTYLGMFRTAIGK